MMNSGGFHFIYGGIFLSVAIFITFLLSSISIKCLTNIGSCRGWGAEDFFMLPFHFGRIIYEVAGNKSFLLIIYTANGRVAEGMRDCQP